MSFNNDYFSVLLSKFFEFQIKRGDYVTQR
jgi:hypothetical protein